MSQTTLINPPISTHTRPPNGSLKTQTTPTKAPISTHIDPSTHTHPPNGSLIGQTTLIDPPSQHIPAVLIGP